MPKANPIPVPSNLIQTQKYFSHSTRLSNPPSLSPCGGRGMGEGAIVKGSNAMKMKLASYVDKTPTMGSYPETI
jgi:hypothetical protein